MKSFKVDISDYHLSVDGYTRLWRIMSKYRGVEVVGVSKKFKTIDVMHNGHYTNSFLIEEVHRHADKIEYDEN